MSTGDMHEHAAWWVIQRGPLSFAVRVHGTPRLIHNEDVWWTPEDAQWCGYMSTEARPVGVRDVAQSLRLPSAPLSDEPWVIAAGNDETEPWALVADFEPFEVADAEEVEPPWLPTDIARKLIPNALQSADGYFLVIDPDDLIGLEEIGDGEVSLERIEARRKQLNAEQVRETVHPDLLVTQSDGLSWAIDARRVHMVVRAEKVSPLPGAADIVWGLTTITGRVNLLIDPSRALGSEQPRVPCWVSAIEMGGAKWAVATAGDWEVLSEDDVEDVDDHRDRPGPSGLVTRVVRHGNRIIYVLSVDGLADLARGDAIADAVREDG